MVKLKEKEELEKELESAVSKRIKVQSFLKTNTTDHRKRKQAFLKLDQLNYEIMELNKIIGGYKTYKIKEILKIN